MPPTILVAEADQTSLELITAVLTRNGFRVLATPDGGDALSRFIEHAPELVLCSDVLPSLSGTQLCRQIKAQRADTRVVLLATTSDNEVVQEAGCDAVLAPPFRFTALAGPLAEWGFAAEQPPPPELSFSVPVPEPADVELDGLAPVSPQAPQASAALLPLPLPLEPGAEQEPAATSASFVAPQEASSPLAASIAGVTTPGDEPPAGGETASRSSSLWEDNAEADTAIVPATQARTLSDALAARAEAAEEPIEDTTVVTPPSAPAAEADTEPEEDVTAVSAVAPPAGEAEAIEEPEEDATVITAATLPGAEGVEEPDGDVTALTAEAPPAEAKDEAYADEEHDEDVTAPTAVTTPAAEAKDEADEDEEQAEDVTAVTAVTTPAEAKDEPDADEEQTEDVTAVTAITTPTAEAKDEADEDEEQTEDVTAVTAVTTPAVEAKDEPDEDEEQTQDVTAVTAVTTPAAEASVGPYAEAQAPRDEDAESTIDPRPEVAPAVQTTTSEEAPQQDPIAPESATSGPELVLGEVVTRKEVADDGELLDVESLRAEAPKTEPTAAAPATTDDDGPELDLQALQTSAASAPPAPRPAAPTIDLDLEALRAEDAAGAKSPAPSKPADEEVPIIEPAPLGAGVLPPSLPRYGDLSTMPLPRLIFEVYVATFSGAIMLARRGVKRTIYVKGGLPVNIDSDQADESLGRILLAHGRITEAQYQGALETAQEHGWNEGEALVDLGAIRRAELLTAMGEATEQRLVSIFSWREGTYRIDSNTAFTDNLVLTEVHPLRCIFRGVREHYDLASLMSYFAKLRHHYVVATDLFSVHFETLGPFLRDLDIVSLLDGNTTFEAALRSDDRRALEITQALYVLLVTDMVRAAGAPGPKAVVPSRPVIAARDANPVDYREMTRVCEEVANEYMRVKEGDYFDALRVDVTTPPVEVEQAFATLVRAYLPESLPPGLPEDVQRRAREIVEVLGRARSVLRDTALRERYIAAQRARYQQNANAPQAGAGTLPAAGPMPSVSVELDRGAAEAREQRVLAERAYAEAQRLLTGGQLQEARQKLEAAIRLHSGEPGYRVGLGMVLMAMGPRDPTLLRQAATCFQQALQLDPANTEASFQLARILAAAGKKDVAAAYLERVLQRAPEHKEARALLARLRL